MCFSCHLILYHQTSSVCLNASIHIISNIQLLQPILLSLIKIHLQGYNCSPHFIFKFYREDCLSSIDKLIGCEPYCCILCNYVCPFYFRQSDSLVLLFPAYLAPSFSLHENMDPLFCLFLLVCFPFGFLAFVFVISETRVPEVGLFLFFFLPQKPKFLGYQVHFFLCLFVWPRRFRFLKFRVIFLFSCLEVRVPELLSSFLPLFGASL